jgi:hypothetical protein
VLRRRPRSRLNQRIFQSDADGEWPRGYFCHPLGSVGERAHQVGGSFHFWQCSTPRPTPQRGPAGPAPSVHWSCLDPEFRGKAVLSDGGGEQASSLPSFVRIVLDATVLWLTLPAAMLHPSNIYVLEVQGLKR